MRKAVSTRIKIIIHILQSISEKGNHKSNCRVVHAKLSVWKHLCSPNKSKHENKVHTTKHQWMNVDMWQSGSCSSSFLFPQLVGGKMSSQVERFAIVSFTSPTQSQVSRHGFISKVNFRPKWLALSPSVTAARDHLTASNFTSSARSTSKCFRMRKLNM
jgi:hypothetical protein